MKPVPKIRATTEEMEEFGRQSPETRARAILATMRLHVGRDLSDREVRAWARDQRAIADAADAIAEEMAEKRLRLVTQRIEELTRDPVRVTDYLKP